MVDEIGIGEFARRARLSVKALRLYDERGVLEPARVDKDSGYRHYDVAQLERARLVAMLRQLDVPRERAGFSGERPRLRPRRAVRPRCWLVAW